MTRDCPVSEYCFHSVPSFFPRRDELSGGVTVNSFLQKTPVLMCLTTVNLEELKNALPHEELHKKAEEMLTQKEVNILKSFSYSKRRMEWLGGRIAVKQAALILLERVKSENMTSLSVHSKENGAPELVHNITGVKNLSISISHSGNFAVGMATFAANCGVDIQKISEKTLKVVTKFAEPDEIKRLEQALPECGTIKQLSLLWSAKEAYKKALLADQPAIFQGVRLESIRVDHLIHLDLQTDGKNKNTAEITAAILGDYVIAFTTRTNNDA